MGQAGGVEAIALAGQGHGRHQLARGAGVGAIVVAWRNIRPTSFQARDLLVGRDDDLLGHVAYLGIGHDQHRQAIGFGEVESVDGQIEEFLGRVGR